MHLLKGGRRRRCRCRHRRRLGGRSVPSGAMASAAAVARRWQSASLHSTRQGTGRTAMLRGVPRRSQASADSRSRRSLPKAARSCAATRARPQRQLGWPGRRRRTLLPRGHKWPRSVPHGSSWRCSRDLLHADAAARRATAAAASALQSRRARRVGGARPGPGRLAAEAPEPVAAARPARGRSGHWPSALAGAEWARRVAGARRWRPRRRRQSQRQSQRRLRLRLLWRQATTRWRVRPSAAGGAV